MKITKSHLRKIIQEELEEARAVNVSDPVRAVGGADHPRLEEWAFKLMNELTPEIPALQQLQKVDGAVKRIADGTWEGIMDALRLAPNPSESAESRSPSPLDEYQEDDDYREDEPSLSWEETLNSLAESIDAALGLDASVLDDGAARLITNNLNNAASLVSEALNVYNDSITQSQEGTEQ